ncbi:hypothetical protein [Parapedobacter sp. 10938]|uniref:hypothetical protein n=1 Tax=Parapedobacter flavus TaxID=3110225 RepID=UPI002DB63C76|nr:hypothetical protein [Parapedobacter sp. 10938]MEC3879166.1 hypothetical protein [Parapedobacter sp. 10938]
MDIDDIAAHFATPILLPAFRIEAALPRVPHTPIRRIVRHDNTCASPIADNRKFLRMPFLCKSRPPTADRFGILVFDNLKSLHRHHVKIIDKPNIAAVIFYNNISSGRKHLLPL